MRMKDPKPEIVRLEELASAVKNGEIRLPKFQRSFVWTKHAMLNLLDSIYNGYPIGSILLWNSSENLKSETSVFGFDIETNTERYPTSYLLDGQQRLTTLCGALYWEGEQEASIWNICFDLDTETFVHSNGPIPINLFPLNRLIKTSEFIRQCMKFEHHQDGKKYYDLAETLLKSIKDYMVAVVRIGDIPLDQVAPIFERINSTGRKLTVVDLMRAATWKGGFNLTETIETTNECCKKAGFGEVYDSLILRSIAVSAGLGINKDDIDKLRKLSPEQLVAAATSASDAILSALRFLRSCASCDDLSFLPYGLQLTLIAEFFRLNKNPSPEKLDELSKWFWETSVSRYFAGASTGQTTRDLAAMRAFALEGKLRQNSGPIDVSQFLFDEFNLKNATSTTFALLLKHCRPKTSLSGPEIPPVALKEKTRGLFSDLFRGTSFKNQNVGQVIDPFHLDLEFDRIDGAGQTDRALHLVDDGILLSLRKGESYGYAYDRRIELVCEKLKALTGREVEFSPKGQVMQVL